jgi:hypothetical protein
MGATKIWTEEVRSSHCSSFFYRLENSSLEIICFAALFILPEWELNNKILDFLQVKSKLEVLASYADAKIGLVTHGWITKIEKHGCFVRFYNGVQGFVSRLIPHFLMKFIS